MKKFYLLILTLLSVISIRANAESTLFGYCGEINTKCTEVYPNFGVAAAIEIPQITAATFEGKELIGVSLGFGTGKNRDVEIFLTYDLKEKPFYTQISKVEKDESFNEILLETPYAVEGKPFFVGYKYLATDRCYPVVYDGDASGANPLGNWKSFPGYSNPSEGDYIRYWEHNYESCGNNCIRLILSGEESDAASAEVSGVDVPVLVAPGESFFATVSVTNTSFMEINSVTVDWTIGEDSKGSADLIFDSPILPGSTGRASMMMYASDEDNQAMPMTFSISKVNDAPNVSADRVYSSTLVNSALAFVRRVVVEKYTGVGCGYCPLAMYAFDRMIEEVTDGSFIPVEVHNYGSDPLYCSSYYDWMYLVGISGAPSASYNRVRSCPTNGPSYSMMKAQYNTLHLPTFLDIRLESVLEGQQAKVKTTTVFSRDIDSHNYGIGFILTEDNLGPYAQSNNYGGTGNTEVGPYGQEKSVFLTTYDNVARQLFNIKGAAGSIPSSVKAGESYEYNTTLDLSNCKELTKVKVVAFVANRSTGEILNAVRASLGKSTSVEKVDNEVKDVRAVVEGGNLSVEGNYRTASVYSLGGDCVATLLQGDNVALLSGVYIVRAVGADGKDRVLKVMVR